MKQAEPCSQEAVDLEIARSLRGVILVGLQSTSLTFRGERRFQETYPRLE